MTSQKQIDANRRNAQKSTGARSDAGKANSRRNAIRDNLTGQITTLSDEERPIFEKLKTDHIASLAPANPAEFKLAHAIAWDTWRLDRLRAVEMNMYSVGAEEADLDDPDLVDTAFTDARTFSSESKRFERMSLYESRMSRSLHRNVAELRELQKERKRNYEHDKKEEMLIARIHEFNQMPYKASTRPSVNGFVFSDEEIAIEMVRQRYVETAKAVLNKSDPTRAMHGGLDIGCGDSWLRTLPECGQLRTTPLETLARWRQTKPEDFFLPKT